MEIKDIQEYDMINDHYFLVQLFIFLILIYFDF